MEEVRERAAWRRIAEQAGCELIFRHQDEPAMNVLIVCGEVARPVPIDWAMEGF